MHRQSLNHCCLGVVSIVLVLAWGGQQTRAPADQSARLAQLRRLYEESNWSDVITEAQRLLDSHPTGEALAETLLHKGSAHGKRKAWEEGEASLKSLLVLTPDSEHAPEAAYRTGLIHLIRREPGLARKVFDDLLRRYPTSPWSARARRLGGSR